MGLNTDEKILKFLLEDPIATARAMLDVLRPQNGDGPNPVREELYRQLYRWYQEQISDGMEREHPEAFYVVSNGAAPRHSNAPSSRL